MDNPDQEMMRILYLKYRATLIQQIQSKIQDPDDIENIIVDAITKATLSYGRLRDKSKEENWIRKIAKNEMLMFLKRKSKEKKHILGDSIENIIFNARFSSPSAEKQAVDDYEYRELVKFLSGLPEQSRLVLEYRLAGKTYKEIFKITGISEGTSKSIVSRTLSRYNNNRMDDGGDHDDRRQEG